MKPPPEVMLEVLKNDSDQGVRDWATFGLETSKVNVNV